MVKGKRLQNQNIDDCLTEGELLKSRCFTHLLQNPPDFPQNSGNPVLFCLFYLTLLFL